MPLDENMSDPRLASRLRARGHDPILAPDVGLGSVSVSVSDPRVLIFSIAESIPVSTRDSDDFEYVHDLVIAALGHHAGILIVRFDNDPRHNLTDRGIGTAISKLEASGVGIRDQIHVLNHWRQKETNHEARCRVSAELRCAGEETPDWRHHSCAWDLDQAPAGIRLSESARALALSGRFVGSLERRRVRRRLRVDRDRHSCVDRQSRR